MQWGGSLPFLAFDLFEADLYTKLPPGCQKNGEDGPLVMCFTSCPGPETTEELILGKYGRSLAGAFSNRRKSCWSTLHRIFYIVIDLLLLIAEHPANRMKDTPREKVIHKDPSASP